MMDVEDHRTTSLDPAMPDLSRSCPTAREASGEGSLRLHLPALLLAHARGFKCRHARDGHAHQQDTVFLYVCVCGPTHVRACLFRGVEALNAVELKSVRAHRDAWETRGPRPGP